MGKKLKTAAILAVAAILWASGVTPGFADFKPGFYRCKDNDNPGNFLFTRDGSGLFATEEYIAYFNWKERNEKLELVMLKGRQEDGTLTVDLAGPEAFRFEKYSYSRLQNVRIDKYTLLADSRTGSLVVATSEKAAEKDAKAFLFINIRDNKLDNFCEIEAVCRRNGATLTCHDDFKRRKQAGKIILHNFGDDTINLESTISGAHNYAKQCDYNGKFRLVK